MLAALRALLIRAAGAQTSHHARYCSMVWVATAFARDELTTRYACLMTLADARTEVAEASARALRPIARAASAEEAATIATAADIATGADGGGDGAAAAAAPPPPVFTAPPPPVFTVGMRVTHIDKKTKIVRLGAIAAVHTDDASSGGGGAPAVEPYYTVSLEDGSERSVEGRSLKPLRDGWPSLAAIAAIVTTRTEVHPPPAAVAGGGVFTTGGVASEALAVATSADELTSAHAPSLPLASLPGVISYMIDCLSIEAKALAAHRASAASADAPPAAAADHDDAWAPDADDATTPADETSSTEPIVDTTI